MVDDAGGAKLGNIRPLQVERLEAKLAVERGLRWFDIRPGQRHAPLEFGLVVPSKLGGPSEPLGLGLHGHDAEAVDGGERNGRALGQAFRPAREGRCREVLGDYGRGALK